ncbi:MAG: hypothetical protein CVU84_03520 [Firmicutes bacterium HGW-Firmicutes-1]|jgi:voltage-gated potassium channel|nr:MAG: hypothetical protein CVU84_03520 [Firmicutes bacterium HGW-Firmicutes-1]
MFKLKNRIYEIMELTNEHDNLAKAFDYSILALITINVAAIILESYKNIYAAYYLTFLAIERVSIVVFTIEYVLRLWLADLHYTNENRKIWVRIKYIFTFMALIDLFAILPFYFPVLIGYDLRVFRIARLFRVMKLTRYSRAMKLIKDVIKAKKDELFAMIMIMLILIIISSTIMFYIESPSQPEAFPNIIATCWWSIATLTTVGYGDVYPVTWAGKILSSIIAIFGIGLIALPTGIVSTGFIDVLKNKDKDNICPYCGKKINH